MQVSYSYINTFGLQHYWNSQKKYQGPALRFGLTSADDIPRLDIDRFIESDTPKLTGSIQTKSPYIVGLLGERINANTPPFILPPRESIADRLGVTPRRIGSDLQQLIDLNSGDLPAMVRLNPKDICVWRKITFPPKIDQLPLDTLIPRSHPKLKGRAQQNIDYVTSYLGGRINTCAKKMPFYLPPKEALATRLDIGGTTLQFAYQKLVELNPAESDDSPPAIERQANRILIRRKLNVKKTDKITEIKIDKFLPGTLQELREQEALSSNRIAILLGERVNTFESKFPIHIPSQEIIASRLGVDHKTVAEAFRILQSLNISTDDESSPVKILPGIGTVINQELIVPKPIIYLSIDDLFPAGTTKLITPKEKYSENVAYIIAKAINEQQNKMPFYLPIQAEIADKLGITEKLVRIASGILYDYNKSSNQESPIISPGYDNRPIISHIVSHPAHIKPISAASLINIPWQHGRSDTPYLSGVLVQAIENHRSELPIWLPASTDLSNVFNTKDYIADDLLSALNKSLPKDLCMITVPSIGRFVNASKVISAPEIIQDPPPNFPLLKANTEEGQTDFPPDVRLQAEIERSIVPYIAYFLVQQINRHKSEMPLTITKRYELMKVFGVGQDELKAAFDEILADNLYNISRKGRDLLIKRPLQNKIEATERQKREVQADVIAKATKDTNYPIKFNLQSIIKTQKIDATTTVAALSELAADFPLYFYIKLNTINGQRPYFVILKRWNLQRK